MMEEKLITEAELLKILGLRKSSLSELRYKGLPFVKLSHTCRVYFLSDIMAWSKGRRIVLNQDVQPMSRDEKDTFGDD